MVYRSNGRYRNDGRMSDSRVAWAQVVLGTFEIRQHAPGTSDEEGAEGQIGANIRLGITRPGAFKPASYNLTAMTLEELTTLRSLFDLAFDLAEPVVRERDEVAQRAKADGDDSYARVYRAVPKLVIREGKIIQHGEGLRDGSEDVPSGHQSGTDGADGVGGGRAGGAGDGLASEAPSDAGASDDGAETDEP